MARWFADTAPVLDDDLDPCDVIEAETRRRMAAITKARGFDSQRERDDDVAYIDVLLDRWNELLYTTNGSVPTIAGKNCYPIPAGVLSVDNRFTQDATAGYDIIKFISEGTPTLTVVRA